MLNTVNVFEKIKLVVLGLLVLSSFYFGWQTYSLNKKIADVGGGLNQVVNFINQAIQANQQANPK